MPTTPRLTRLRGWLLSLRVPSQFIMRKRSSSFFVIPKWSWCDTTNPNIMHNTTHNNNVEAPTSEVVPAEIAQLLESNSSTLDSDDANLVQQLLPGMVDDDNQPLPENIPTPAEEGQDAPQFFSTWEHSGSCYHCIAGGCKHKACLSFNTDVKPTIQQLFKMFFFKPYVVGIIIPQTNICLKEEKHHPVSYGEFLHCLVCGSSWQQSMVQNAQIFCQWVRLIVLLVHQ